MWFRSDLRVEDNPALARACAAADRGVVAVFAICPRQWRRHDWGPAKVEFVLRNVACLAEQLKRLCIPLRIVQVPTFADVPQALVNLSRQARCDALYFDREYEVNELRRDTAVARRFAADGIAAQSCDDQTVVPPDALRTRTGKYYTVFTPFKRAWLAHVAAHGTGELPPRPRRQPEMACAGDPIPETLAEFDLTCGSADLWPAGEKFAATRLADFASKRLHTYKADRDFPALDATSALSPYLAAGVISARACYAAAQEADCGRGAAGRAGRETWMSELIWREFYRHVLVGFPRVSMGRAFKLETERLKWRDDEGRFEAWCAGRTGVPIVDAGMRQLAQTGWMHNRLRMIVAMFLVKDLWIDWRWGERHFMRYLVDGDLASNNGGWQWAASTGTDAVPYFRVFNPFAQSRKFDPDGKFIREYVPELCDVAARALHDPVALTPALRSGCGYPEPTCDHAEARRHAIEAFRKLKR